MLGKGSLAGLFPEITASTAQPAEKGGELLSVLLTVPSFTTISQNRKICNVDEDLLSEAGFLFIGRHSGRKKGA